MKTFFGFLLFFLLSPAFAGKLTINNYITEVTEVTEVGPTIIMGVSPDDLAKGLTAVAASGAHNFDFGTYAWQASVQAAFILDTSSDAVSFGVGKRFEFMDTLWTGSYTRFDDNDLVTFGASWRF